MSDSISELRLCEIAGVSRTTRRDWAKRNLLRARDTYEELDAVELCILARLSNVLGSTDAPVAWLQIRNSLPTTPTRELDIVFDTQHKLAFITNNLKLTVGGIRHGRPVRAFSIAADIREIREAFGRVAAAE